MAKSTETQQQPAQSAPAVNEALTRYQINPQAVACITSAIDAGRSAIIAAGAGDFGACMAMGAAVCDLQTLISQDQHITGMLMMLQGKPLGFRTDMDAKGGYQPAVVVGCAVEAYLKGLPPVGNCWNIIAGRTYVTKEGFEFLLRKQGAKYSIVPGMPENEKFEPSPLPGKTGAKTVEMPVTVYFGESTKPHNLRFVIRQNAGMTADAVIGKAKARALKWIYEQIQTNPLLSVEAAPELENAAPSMATLTATAKTAAASIPATSAPAAEPTQAAASAPQVRKSTQKFIEVWLSNEFARNHISADPAAVLKWAGEHGYDTGSTEALAETMPRILREMGLVDPDHALPRGTRPGPTEIQPDEMPDEVPNA